MSFMKISRLAIRTTFPLTSSLNTIKIKGLPTVLCVRLNHKDASKSAEATNKMSSEEYLEGLKAPELLEEEVYYGPLSKRIRSVKLFSLMTSIMGICAQPVILQRAAELEASSAAIAATCGFVGFFTFVTPLLLHSVTKKYVTSVTYDKEADSYTATIYTLFLRKRAICFKPGEAEIPDVGGGFTSAKVRGIPLFMDSRFFSDVHHYKRIMGYDKPLDFKLSVKKELT
uniref:Transmembrane protein 70, mitochondrial n=1 Tax=Lygus hesperus TaxID=30085 RepID=A0A146MBK4_LYGHE